MKAMVTVGCCMEELDIIALQQFFNCIYKFNTTIHESWLE